MISGLGSVTRFIVIPLSIALDTNGIGAGGCVKLKLGMPGS